MTPVLAVKILWGLLTATLALGVGYVTAAMVSQVEAGSIAFVLGTAWLGATASAEKWIWRRIRAPQA